ncbi:MAG: endolytic transglycosylase MltG [Myxococcota bacterium]
MRKKLYGFLAVLVALAGLALCGVYYVKLKVETFPLKGQTTLEVRPGASLRSVLRTLEKDGVVENPDLVYYYARVRGLTQVRTGTYSVGVEQTPEFLLQMLNEGRVVTEKFTITEGYNRWQLRQVLADGGWVTADEFDALCDDKEFLQANDVPGPNCEGYLFPETYTFARGVPARKIFETLFKAWRTNLADVQERLGGGPLSLSPREFTTLASIVEKETGASEERPRIACVFYNRLKSKPVMKLQTDPTVIYAATLNDPNFDGNIKSYHLREMDHPYNTYLRVGLPPGPIAAAGKAAFEAVAAPVECNDLFFVSKNNGRHVFCPTYECHLQNVQKWQVQYFKKKR